MSKEAKKHFHWDSEAGKEVTKRLEAWGAREREIQATGDASAMPAAFGTGGRGKPGDLPGVWHAAMDVDITLTEWRSGGTMMHRLLWFIYRDGTEERIVSQDWHFPDGTVKNLPFYDAETLSQMEAEDRERAERAAAPPHGADYCSPIVRQFTTYDLNHFQDEVLDSLISFYYPGRGRAFRNHRNRFLLRALFDFGRFMAINRGLGEFARRKAS